MDVDVQNLIFDLYRDIEKEIMGQPKPYSWPAQNYNAGHDQAIHKVLRMIRRKYEEHGQEQQNSSTHQALSQDQSQAR